MQKNKKISICLEHRFYEYNGNIYTKLSFPYAYWNDYLSFFDTITIIARAKKIDKVDKNMALVTGPNVNYEPLPYYIGIKEFILKFPFLFFKILKISLKYNHFLLRSGNSTNILALLLIIFKKPFLREYPGNIEEGIIGFAGNSIKIRFIAKISHSIAKFQGKFSNANSFVSEYCKQLYSSNKPSYIFSSFKSSEITYKKNNFEIKEKYKIISVGRLEKEKGHLNLLKAICKINQNNLYQIHLIGDGGQKLILEDFSKKNNLNVIFHGSITDRDYLFSLLKESDIFVIPSYTEGMPRALLEAMTIGLPCIGTNVGGIPEVLQHDILYTPDDLNKLISLLEHFRLSEDERQLHSIKNQEIINENYSDEVLQVKKHNFWSKVYE